jgi:ribosomal protein S25
MSVLEELRSMKEQVLARLRELEPLVAEYEELRRVADELSLDYEPGDQAAPRSRPAMQRPAKPRAAATKRRPARRARRGRRRSPVSSDTRKAQVLEQIGKHPGTTVPQIGKRLGVDYTGLYRVVRALERDGDIRKDGSKLELAAS